MVTATEDFSQWIGRTEAITDDLSPATVQAAAATFDEDPEPLAAGAALPPLWHWFYFLPRASQPHLGEDGHPRREMGSFMPPIPLPRRMFAGARLTWRRPLVIGRPARREAVIRDIKHKAGRTGSLAFVTVVCRYYQEQASGAPATSTAPVAGEALCLEEEQDIVYREPGAPLPPPQSAELAPIPAGSWSRIIVPDTRLLFRFSALTFNAHRIHYDRPYAIGEEGYPGLVVHGPLTAMLLMKLVRDNAARAVNAFRFRSQGPLFDLAPFRLVATPNDGQVELRAEGPDAKTAMQATAEIV